MRLRMNYSKRCSRWRFPQRVTIDPNLSRTVTISLSECKDIFVGVMGGVSGTPSVYAGMQFSTAELQCGNRVASHHLRILLRSDSNSLALYTSSVWPLSGAPKVRICTIQRIGLSQLLITYFPFLLGWRFCTCLPPGNHWTILIGGSIVTRSHTLFLPWTLPPQRHCIVTGR